MDLIDSTRFPGMIRTSNISQFLTVKNNIITNHSTHQGTVVADCPIPSSCKCFYYEITVTVREEKCICVVVVFNL